MFYVMLLLCFCGFVSMTTHQHGHAGPCCAQPALLAVGGLGGQEDRSPRWQKCCEEVTAVVCRGLWCCKKGCAERGWVASLSF